MQYKVTHLTSAHPRFDTRIFFKECKSLSLKYDVTLIVSDGLGEQVEDGIKILDVGKAKNRFERFFLIGKKILNKAISLNSDCYHFHDPELIPIGLKLKKLGKKVVFDIHENISLQIKDKSYIPYYLRGIVSFCYKHYEKFTINKFDILILAENSYFAYYKELNSNIEIVLNMPDIEKLNKFINYNRNKNEIFYIGGISKDRGLDVNLDALRILNKETPDVFLHYIGPLYGMNKIDIKLDDIKDNVKFYNSLPLSTALNYSINSKVGLSILKPISNYKLSYSTKIFEYMAIGLPVVTSNFDIYVDIIEKYGCGICVNPNDPNDISIAIKKIMNDTELAKSMGRNGRKIVESKFNWSNEKIKLYDVYTKIFN